jgi:hypothetical protein
MVVDSVWAGGMRKQTELCSVWSVQRRGGGRGGHRHLQKGRMLDIDLISEPPTPPPPDVLYVSKVWESVWPEGQEASYS